MNDKVMVAGAGKSGIAAAKLLLETGGTVLLYDSNEKLDTEKVLAEFPENAKITLKLGELEKPDFAGIQICVMSPGIDLETPFVKLLTDNKVQLWSEIELGYQVAKGQLVAVTGTNGKTTTVTLTGQIMKNAFEDAFTVCASSQYACLLIALASFHQCALWQLRSHCRALRTGESPAGRSHERRWHL